jgi:deoxyribodipyrimidine photolyase-related protein
VAEKSGPKACPFNYLYWDFIARNRERLGGNPRMALIYKALDRLPEPELQAIQASAANFLERLGAGKLNEV